MIFWSLAIVFLQKVDNIMNLELKGKLQGIDNKELFTDYVFDTTFIARLIICILPFLNMLIIFKTIDKCISDLLKTDKEVK